MVELHRYIILLGLEALQQLQHVSVESLLQTVTVRSITAHTFDNPYFVKLAPFREIVPHIKFPDNPLGVNTGINIHNCGRSVTRIILYRQHVELLIPMECASNHYQIIIIRKLCKIDMK